MVAQIRPRIVVVFENILASSSDDGRTNMDGLQGTIILSPDTSILLDNRYR